MIELRREQQTVEAVELLLVAANAPGLDMPRAQMPAVEQAAQTAGVLMLLKALTKFALTAARADQL